MSDEGLTHFLIVNSQACAWLNEILSFIIVATSEAELFVTSTEICAVHYVNYSKNKDIVTCYNVRKNN